MFCRKRAASHRRNLHVQAVKGTAGGLDKRRAASDRRTSDSRLREETALTGVRFSRFLFARVTGDSEEVRSEGGAQLLSITATSTLRWKKGSEQMLEKAAPEKNKRVTFFNGGDENPFSG